MIRGDADEAQGSSHQGGVIRTKPLSGFKEFAQLT
jgi:hypothetical protein